MVERLLNTKFGELLEGALVRLSAAGPDELEQLASRVLDANNLDDIFSS